MIADHGGREIVDRTTFVTLSVILGRSEGRTGLGSRDLGHPARPFSEQK